MDPVSQLTGGLVRYGPALLGVLTFLETSSLLGLFVPAGVCFLIAAFLTTQGTLALSAVVLWALAGAVLGDSAGYWMGRWRGGLEHAESGLVARAVAKAGPERLAMLNGAPLTSVSLARVVSFARTLAPLAAGAGRMSYARYLTFDLLGIAAWSATYVGVGVLAGESWQRVSGWVGAAWGAVFVGVALWVWRKRRTRGAQVLHVGLTGNAASGKSTVAALWREWGWPVVDADQLARDAVVPGSRGLAEVEAAFGSDVLAPDGTLDRSALGARVFADPEERVRLEAILHPRIAELREQWGQARAAEGHSVLVSEVPLLFEAGMQDQFDRVVLVHVPRDVSRARLVRDRGMDEAAADAVLDAQLDSSNKRAQSDHVIDNTGGLDDLRDQARSVFDLLEQTTRNAKGPPP